MVEAKEQVGMTRRHHAARQSPGALKDSSNSSFQTHAAATPLLRSISARRSLHGCHRVTLSLMKKSQTGYALRKKRTTKLTTGRNPFSYEISVHPGCTKLLAQLSCNRAPSQCPVSPIIRISCPMWRASSRSGSSLEAGSSITISSGSELKDAEFFSIA